MTDINQMSGPELVQEYNRIATSLGLPPVNRFPTLEAGRRRCAALALRNAAPLPQEEDLLLLFGTSTRKYRGKLIKALADNIGRQVPVSQLLKAVYDSTNEKNLAPLSMVLRGMKNTIKSERLPYEVKTAKSEAGAKSYGLYKAQGS